MVEMKNKIFDHWGLKLLSLIIAILIWIIVANVDDYKTTKHISGIEIEFINGEAITGKNKVYELPKGLSADIVVKGRRKVVEHLTSEDFKAVADLSKISITNAVKVEISPVSSYIAKDLTVSYTDDSVLVGIEEKVKKQLPISVRTIAKVPEGYAIRNKTAAPNLITVEGAESVVNAIEEVVVDVNVKDANHTLRSYAVPVFLDRNGNAMDASKFIYDVKEVDVMVEILKTKKLNVKVKTQGDLKEGYAISKIDYQPTSILVVGEVSDLARVDEIIIDDIDVTDCEKDLETSVVIADYLPSGIVLAEDIEAVMAKVMIEKIEEKTLEVDEDDINIVGKQEGYSYTYKDEEEYKLNVSGLADDLKDMKISNLIPSIDVTGYGPGTYTFTVDLRESKKIQIEEDLIVTLEIAAIE